MPLTGDDAESSSSTSSADSVVSPTETDLVNFPVTKAPVGETYLSESVHPVTTAAGSLEEYSVTAPVQQVLKLEDADGTVAVGEYVKMQNGEADVTHEVHPTQQNSE
uniref:G5 domain-containing protein n=1 Tax=Syphacia muris TaxID=451379 RepID=A0A0N5AMN2_9BILA